MTKKGAIYLRLSKDDNIGAESESITSQRFFLLQYAEKNRIEISYEFTDDGLSGTNWQRHALQQLLRTIESGQIDTVLVKDLSRLSRDYIRTGELIEKWFPEHGVRLIAVNDGVDTGRQSASNDFFPIKAVMDDWYARDISRKVRAAIYARQKAGICTAANLPYGYIRNGETIQICCSQAEIIQRIYQEYANGISCCAIASALNMDGVPPIRKHASGWSDTTVRRILSNPAYIGKLMLHKTEKASYKSTQKQCLPAIENIVYPVPALIPEPLFLQVQQRMKSAAHKAKTKDFLSGTVTCALCGSKMYCTGSDKSARLICSARKRRHGCRNPSIRRDTLISLIQTAFSKDGINVNSVLFPELVAYISISQEAVLLHVKYRNPHGQELPESPPIGRIPMNM